MITLSITVKNRVEDWTPSMTFLQIYARPPNIDKVKFILDSETILPLRRLVCLMETKYGK